MRRRRATGGAILAAALLVTVLGAPHASAGTQTYNYVCTTGVPEFPATFTITGDAPDSVNPGDGFPLTGMTIAGSITLDSASAATVTNLDEAIVAVDVIFGLADPGDDNLDGSFSEQVTLTKEPGPDSGEETISFSDTVATPSSHTAGSTLQDDVPFEPDTVTITAVSPAVFPPLTCTPGGGGGSETIAAATAEGPFTETDIVAPQAETPTVSIADKTIVEGNGGRSPLRFQVSLSGPSAQKITVKFVTSDGTALKPGDYKAASGQLVFKPGQTTKQIEVLVVGDRVREPLEERFHVTLFDPVNVTLGDAVADGIIIDNDPSSRGPL